MTDTSTIAPPHEDELALEVRRRACKARLLGEQGPGPRIERFVLDRVLGRGAMGVVYLAHDERLDRPVAIKVLRADATEVAERLEREARVLARLNHPNVVTVYEVAEHHGVCIVMEYVAGQTLREWMARPQPLMQRIGLLRQAAQGLAAAHAIGLVHRDFKPHNAIVGDDGRLRIVDFGLATAPLSDTTIPGRPGDVGPEMSRLTEAGARLGTPAYMAPEVLRGGTPSAASDQFALGCVGFELVFGRHPFEERARDDPPPRPHDGRVPGSLVDALMRAIAPEPSARGPDLRALIDACAPTTRPRRSAVPVAVAAALVLVATAALVVLRSDEQARPPSCDPTLAMVSRHTITSNLALAHDEAASLPSLDDRTHARLRAAQAELALGRWGEACTHLAILGVHPLEGAEASCWRSHYCGDPQALSARARCFGGDVEQCKVAAIPHEYEYLASRAAVQAGDDGAASSMQMHHAYWIELLEVACELGDRASCTR